MSEFFLGGSLSCINHFAHLLVQFVIEIVVTSCLSRRTGYAVVFRAKLDVEHCHNSTNHTQSNQVKVGECCGYEAEVEERHQVASTHHVDNHRITNHHDHATGDIQTIGHHFRNRIQHVLDFAGTNRQGNDDGRNSHTHCLQEQRRNVDPGNRCQVAVISSLIRSVLESNGDSTNDDGQYLARSGQRDCQCDTCTNALMTCDNQNSRNDGSQSGVRRNCSTDVHPAQRDHFQRTTDNNTGFHIAKNDTHQGTRD
ncbi:Hypothetical protein c2225 [Escherichia coli CFT073]|uniref:Uncharacterized protein n=1 Tax=Escherichia coli O6:H1 (strain CFT073 / ATCC 700928 / UPEC) TaxID=199310 RepID=A0A0H2V7Y9_ECOL6|nr:Hypothetical protein c2225 [Escherichia coli CFT073]